MNTMPQTNKIKDDASQLRDDMSDTARRGADHLKETLSQTGQSVQDAGKRVMEGGRVVAREGWDMLERRVVERPVGTLAIVAAAAFVVGWLMRR